MDYKTRLEELTGHLVGRRIARVRYEVMTCDVWDEFGPDVDAAVDSLLLDLDGGEPAYLTWSNESGFCYGLTVVYKPHWVDSPNDDRSEGWTTADVSASSRWREVIGDAVTEARVVWDRVFSEEVPAQAVTRGSDEIYIGTSKTIPTSVALVPQELALKFDSGRWVVISAARYHGEGKGFWAWMDELLVVHDDAFMRKHMMGPYAPPPFEALP